MENTTETHGCCNPKPYLSEKEAIARLRYLDGWTIVENDGKRTLAKYYKMQDFSNGVQLLGAIEVATRQFQHHPEVHLGPFELSVFWHTLPG